MDLLPAGIAGRLSLGVALACRALLERADELAARVAPKDRPGLLIFLFHTLFASEAEADSDLVDPHERATCERLARLFLHFRQHGYRFVSASEIDRGLPPEGRFAHVTFDDGFANNLHLLDLLPREEVPVTVFPSVHHVREGRAFWWNVVYRERRRRGHGAAVAPEVAKLRRLPAAEVDRHLVTEFGPRGREPAGDLDRPLTVEELRELASSPWIEIGNHALDHAALTSLSSTDAEAQVAGAQRWLGELLGEPPFFIAYPNGDADAGVIDLARRRGLRLGATVAPSRNELPTAGGRMELGRFRIVFDRRERHRMRAVRSSVQLAPAARALVLGRARSRPEPRAE